MATSSSSPLTLIRASSSSSPSSLNHQPNFISIITSPPKSRPFFIFTHRVRCSSVALKQDDSSTTTTASIEEEEEEMSKTKIGARVRVKVPLKVYHVPKVPEVDLTAMEGNIKQYVALWKGKRISANLPYKIEFFTEVEGRGRVKFFAHLKEDEFEYVQDSA